MQERRDGAIAEFDSSLMDWSRRVGCRRLIVRQKKGMRKPCAATSLHHVLWMHIDGRSFAVMQFALFIANPQHCKHCKHFGKEAAWTERRVKFGE